MSRFADEDRCSGRTVTPARGGPALVSIHDVMAPTLDRVAELLALAASAGVRHVTLLVVPGTGWTSAGLAQLRAWADEGHALAGHGWTHRAPRIRGAYHRLHSLFVSRDCAEHLALDGPAIIDLLQRCRHWFGANALPVPDLYVPPAWALGPVTHAELRATGFTQLETMGGVLDIPSGRFRRVPLIGFEARSPWQVPVLALSNGVNGWWAGGGLRRVAIHPDDHRLPLRRSLLRWLAASRDARPYRELVAEPRAGAPGPAAPRVEAGRSHRSRPSRRGPTR